MKNLFAVIDHLNVQVYGRLLSIVVQTCIEKTEFPGREFSLDPQRSAVFERNSYMN